MLYGLIDDESGLIYEVNPTTDKFRVVFSSGIKTGYRNGSILVNAEGDIMYGVHLLSGRLDGGVLFSFNTKTHQMSKITTNLHIDGKLPNGVDLLYHDKKLYFTSGNLNRTRILTYDLSKDAWSTIKEFTVNQNAITMGSNNNLYSTGVILSETIYDENRTRILEVYDTLLMGRPVNNGLVEAKMTALSSENPVSSLHLHLYPNPVKDQLTIQLPQVKNKHAQVFIYNVQGKQVHVVNLYLNDQGHAVNIGHLKPGLYLLRVETNAHNQTVKFLKE